MKCPRCGLFNPDTAQRCDCGYDFATKTVQKAYSTQLLPREIKTMVVFVALYTIVLVWFGLQMNDPGLAVGAVVVALLMCFSYYHLVRKRNWARLTLAVLTFPIGTMLCTTQEAKLYCLQR